MALRHQLAAYSPIATAAFPRAVTAALGWGSDPRDTLVTLLRDTYYADRVILCGSGTQALQIAISSAARRSPGRAVALPAFSCFDVAAAAVGADVPIQLYDVDPETLGPDIESLTHALQAGARTVVISPLYGIPVAWDDLDALAHKYDAVLIEDAAQGHGGTWRGRPLGTLGEISTLSFGRGKGWTGGSGGAVLLRGNELAAEGPVVTTNLGAEGTNLAATAIQWFLGRPNLYGVPRAMPFLHLGETTYKPPVPPRALGRAAAAILLHGRAKSLTEAEVRRANAHRYLPLLRDDARAQTIRVAADAEAGYLRLPIRLADSSLTVIGSNEARRLGIERAYPCDLGELPVVQSRLTGNPAQWPGAAALARELITIPTHSRISASEREQILRLVRAG